MIDTYAPLQGGAEGPSLPALIIAVAVIFVVALANKSSRKKLCVPLAFAALAMAFIPDPAHAFQISDYVGRQHGMGHPSNDIADFMSLAVIIGIACAVLMVRDKPYIMIAVIVGIGGLLAFTGNSQYGYNGFRDGLRQATGGQTFQQERAYARQQRQERQRPEYGERSRQRHRYSQYEE